MRSRDFVLGMAIGVVLGAGGTYVGTTGQESHPELQSGAIGGEVESADAVPSLLGRYAEDPPHQGAASAAESGGAAGGTDASSAAAQEQALRLARQDLWRALREELKALEGQGAGSPAVSERMAHWLAQVLGEDVHLSELAGRALMELASLGLLRPEDVERLALEFANAPVGSSSRPALAAVVARAYAKEARLAEWLEGLPAVDEPAVRQRVLWALDETPSAPYREWVLRLSASEADVRVLNSVWNEDIVVVNLTRESAPRLVATIEPRVRGGDLPAVTRAYGYMALGLAAQHAPVEARRSVEYLLTAERDEGVAAFARAVLDAIVREEANLQSLEGLWDLHARNFEK